MCHISAGKHPCAGFIRHAEAYALGRALPKTSQRNPVPRVRRAARRAIGD
jgi:hypothetical protein